MELGNVGAIPTEEKDRVRKRGDNPIYNYEINIMEREYNFRRWPFRRRVCWLCNFLCDLHGGIDGLFHFLRKLFVMGLTFGAYGKAARTGIKQECESSGTAKRLRSVKTPWIACASLG
jgi:hypothetical protein